MDIGIGYSRCHSLTKTGFCPLTIYISLKICQYSQLLQNHREEEFEAGAVAFAIRVSDHIPTHGASHFASNKETEAGELDLVF